MVSAIMNHQHHNYLYVLRVRALNLASERLRSYENNLMWFVTVFAKCGVAFWLRLSGFITWLKLYLYLISPLTSQSDCFSQTVTHFNPQPPPVACSFENSIFFHTENWFFLFIKQFSSIWTYQPLPMFCIWKQILATFFIFPFQLVFSLAQA